MLVEDMVSRMNANRAHAGDYVTGGLHRRRRRSDCAGLAGASARPVRVGQPDPAAAPSGAAARASARCCPRAAASRARRRAPTATSSPSPGRASCRRPAPASPCGPGDAAFPTETLRRAVSSTVCIALLRDAASAPVAAALLSVTTNMRPSRATAATAAASAALTLIELMVGLTLGLIVIAALLMLFANASARGQDVARAGMQIENGRYVAELLREDLRLAGFYGETSVAGALYTQPIPAAPRRSGWSGTPLDAADAGPGLRGRPTSWRASTDRKPGTDALAVRRVGIDSDRSGDDRAGNTQYYVQYSFCVARRRDAAPGVQQGPGGRSRCATAPAPASNIGAAVRLARSTTSPTATSATPAATACRRSSASTSSAPS